MKKNKKENIIVNQSSFYIDSISCRSLLTGWTAFILGRYIIDCSSAVAVI
mgnify:CR=1 FL=1